MTAIVKALKECLKRGYLEVCIYTDSNYVKQGITQWFTNGRGMNGRLHQVVMLRTKSFGLKLIHFGVN
jgi:ribonuclease HI